VNTSIAGQAGSCCTSSAPHHDDIIMPPSACLWLVEVFCSEGDGGVLREKLARVRKLRSKLSGMQSLLVWQALQGLFPQAHVRRPAYDVVLKLTRLFPETQERQ